MDSNKRNLKRAFASCSVNVGKHSRKEMPASNTDVVSCMKVYVRVRPHNEKELQGNFRNVVSVVDDKVLKFDPKETEKAFYFHGQKQPRRDVTKKQNKDLSFLFDGVFGMEHDNLDVYNSTTKAIISRVLDGYNCSVFVYGATGAGKTYTMLGNENQRGIMYHTMVELYKQIDEISKEKAVKVGVTFLEVYNENIHNLLRPSGEMYLREDSNGTTTVAGLAVEDIMNAEQLFQKLNEGNKNRTQHPTDANAESSRSHAVFQVYIQMMEKNGQQVKFVKLSMIDLAGSERGMATGYKGARFKEGSNINKSLLALGNCISNLADGLRHIPYRNSKLTRLIKDSLGGNCHTIMIANVSPSSVSYEDTYNTLKYAARATNIKTKLTKNMIDNMEVSHYKKLIEEMKKQIMVLKSQARGHELASSSNGKIATGNWCNSINVLFDKKIELRSQLLNVKSEANILSWRIKHTNMIIKGIGHLNDNGVIINKAESSVSQFEARLVGVKQRIAELNKLLSINSQELLSLFKEIEEAGVTRFLQKDIAIKNAELSKSEKEAENRHLTRLLMLQQKRAESSETAKRLKDNIITDFYQILYGHKLVTNEMKKNYESAMQAEFGTKNVYWFDSENDNTYGYNVRNVIDLSLDESFLVINDRNLTPTVLPLTDEVDCEISNCTSNNPVRVNNVEEVLRETVDKNVYSVCSRVNDSVNCVDSNHASEAPNVNPALSETIIISSNDVQPLNEQDVEENETDNLNTTITISSTGDTISNSETTNAFNLNQTKNIVPTKDTISLVGTKKPNGVRIIEKTSQTATERAIAVPRLKVKEKTKFTLPHRKMDSTINFNIQKFKNEKENLINQSIATAISLKNGSFFKTLSKTPARNLLKPVIKPLTDKSNQEPVSSYSIKRTPALKLSRSHPYKITKDKITRSISKVK